MRLDRDPCGSLRVDSDVGSIHKADASGARRDSSVRIFTTSHHEPESE